MPHRARCIHVHVPYPCTIVHIHVADLSATCTCMYTFISTHGWWENILPPLLTSSDCALPTPSWSLCPPLSQTRSWDWLPDSGPWVGYLLLSGGVCVCVCLHYYLQYPLTCMSKGALLSSGCSYYLLMWLVCLTQFSIEHSCRSGAQDLSVIHVCVIR